jgi:hypothetical protein
MQLQCDRVDLERKIDKLLQPFASACFPGTIELSCTRIHGEYQTTVKVTLP